MKRMTDRIGSLFIKPIIETNLAGSFLSHEETSSSSVKTTKKPEDDSMMGSVSK